LLGSQRFTNDIARGNKDDGGKFRELTPVFFVFVFGFASRLVMGAKKLRDFRFADLAVCCLEHKINEFIVAGIEAYVIDSLKYQRGF
jgi:hypothetical protein